MLIDHAQRLQATDPQASYLVQAPAGSGKTEILTQRYLRLLSKVSEPEQIIALTFTRKAANEMRARILAALHLAATTSQADSPHQQMTLNYAKAALAQDTHYQWQLLQQTNRLRVITIDSLCQSINQSIPLLDKQIAYAPVTEKADSHYLQAARECIQFTMENKSYQVAIKTLLLHVDNKLDHLIALFKELLAQREQWLSLLFQARSQEQAVFEQALKIIEQHELNRLKNSLPPLLASQLVSLSRKLAHIENKPESPRYHLGQWSHFQDINQETALALTQLLLTSDQQFRKQFDHHVGLRSDSCPTQEYRQLKEDSKELLIALNDYPEFLNALLQVSKLPEPHYDKEQWEMLQALFLILPILASHLYLVFNEQQETDFSHVAQQALHALGTPDNPTDLTLHLDNSIHHLLVDEFQDTSILQFELISQLVQGWQPGDGKTLFIVGDPMQSIYRFRQAEVGLFYRAKAHGVGPVSLRFIELQCNFRSTPTIVNWVNQHFSPLFPKKIDIESGAVSFHPSTAVLADSESSQIDATSFANRQQEADYLISRIRHELNADATQRLAILVRSRSQLSTIIQLLREQQIPYQGSDIDLLSHLEHIRDAWSITQALLLPGNRLAWLAALRSPYCGLTLDDLHTIAQYDKRKSIYASLLALEKIENLSQDGRIRATFFTRIMHDALLARHQMHLSAWVQQTLKQLHSEHLLTHSQHDDLEQFWLLLDRHEEQGRLSNQHEFMTELNRLYAQQITPSRLQIMTIHKSKGLEFDTVFLPSLGSQPKRPDKPMLRWLKLPTDNSTNLLLLSPIKAAHQEYCPLYDYLSDLDAEKSYYESQRLLYVATTRAKSRLYLLDCSLKPAKQSFRAMLKNQEFLSCLPPEAEIEKPLPTTPLLKRLPLSFYVEEATLILPSSEPALAIPKMKTNHSRLIGIVTHKMLQWICTYHPSTPGQIPWAFAQQELKALGFSPDIISKALDAIKEQLYSLFADPIGAWLIAPHHNEHNEYELLVEHNERLVTRIIDRTFVDQQQLWIIDFKTGSNDQDSQSKHRQQVQNYAEYLSYQSTLPIRCGVYYLANNHWLSW